MGAHAATMTFSYLVLTAMGFLEWRFKGTTGYPLVGVVQVGAIFLGGALLAGTLLLVDATTESGAQTLQAMGGIDLLLNLVSVVLFAIRIWPAVLRGGGWLSATPERHWRAAALFAPVAMAPFMYVISLIIQNPDLSEFPFHIIVALDHTVFIGVITNLAFGHALRLSADSSTVWPWAGQVVFWVLNVGLVVFALGLVADSAEIKRIGAPVMGVGALLGVATIYARLWSSSLAQADTWPSAAGARDRLRFHGTPPGRVFVPFPTRDRLARSRVRATPRRDRRERQGPGAG